jgi:hypothetical protein
MYDVIPVATDKGADLHAIQEPARPHQHLEPHSLLGALAGRYEIDVVAQV